MDVLELKAPPPVVALVIALLMSAVAAQTASLDAPFSGHTTAGLAVAAAGFLIEVIGVLSFALARTSPNPLRPRSASKLVVTGVYRFTRNPMYLGDLLMLMGWGIYLSSVLALLLTPLFVLYLNRFQIMPEERVLSDLFGAEYAAYRSRVRRWL